MKEEITNYADFEIGLRRHPASGYEVDLRYSQPDSNADVRCPVAPAMALPLNSIVITYASCGLIPRRMGAR